MNSKEERKGSLQPVWEGPHEYVPDENGVPTLNIAIPTAGGRKVIISPEQAKHLYRIVIDN